MDSYFASPERKSADKIDSEILQVSDSPVLKTIMKSVGGLFVILNDARQIIACNEEFLLALHIVSVDSIQGKRLGDVLCCENADDYPDGCGTTKKCRTCGAVISMMSCLKKNEPMDNMCIISRRDEYGQELPKDMVFKVKASPFDFDGYRFVLMFLQDITREHDLSVLERVFFHDITNVLSGLLGAVELLNDGVKTEKLFDLIKHSGLRLKNEVDMLVCLNDKSSEGYLPYYENVELKKLISELEGLVMIKFLDRKVTLEVSYDCENFYLSTDVSLVLRVLTNMLINALEASTNDEKVKLTVSRSASQVFFSVNNSAYIAEEEASRIFQRNFTTKNEEGHGIGTFSMKLFGEEIMGGKIDFTSSRKDGTTFSFEIPFREPFSEN